MSSSVPLPSPKGHAVRQPLTRIPVFADGDGQDAHFCSFVPDWPGSYVLEEVLDEMLDVVLQLIHLLSFDGLHMDGKASDSEGGKECSLTFYVAPVFSRSYPARMPATSGKEGAVV